MANTFRSYLKFHNTEIEIECSDNLVLSIKEVQTQLSFLENKLSKSVKLFLKNYLETGQINRKQLVQQCDTSLFTEFQRSIFPPLVSQRDTLTYSDLSNLAFGSPKYARAIGNALNKNPFPFIIPCHLVISSNPKNIGGFVMGRDIKQYLIKLEATRTKSKERVNR